MTSKEESEERKQKKKKEEKEKGLERGWERGKRKRKYEGEKRKEKKGNVNGEEKVKGEGKRKFACSVTNLRSPAPQTSPVNPGPDQGQVPWRHPGTGEGQAQGDLPASTETWSHPYIPGLRLLGPAYPHPSKQLCCTQRDQRPPSASLSHTARWGEPTSLALRGNSDERLSWAQVVSPCTVPRPGQGGPD